MEFLKRADLASQAHRYCPDYLARKMHDVLDAIGATNPAWVAAGDGKYSVCVRGFGFSIAVGGNGTNCANLKDACRMFNDSRPDGVVAEYNERPAWPAKKAQQWDKSDRDRYHENGCGQCWLMARWDKASLEKKEAN
jgi:hypothetical protein